jgi:PAS domain S-box-containing protein
MKFTSITQRLLVWFLLIALLPVLLIAYILLRNVEQELHQTAVQHISAIADKKSDQIDTYLSDLLRGAHLKTQEQTTHQPLVEFTRVFARGGEKSAAYRRLDASYRSNFQRFINAAGYYDLFLISPQGTVVYSQTHEADFATNLLTGPYRNTGLGRVTRSALSSLESGISEFDFYAPSGAAAAFIAVPVIREGEIAGVLALQINNRRILQVLLDSTGLGETGETVVARREDEHTALLMAPLRLDAYAAMKRKISLSDRERAAPLINALNGERGSGYAMDYSGQPVVAAWRYLPRMGWGMVTKINAEEAFAPLYRVRNFALVVLVLALSAALLAAILLGRRLINPLHALKLGAQEIAAGKLEQRIPVRSNDELGQLAMSFNTMAEKMQFSYQNLERLVNERTVELAQSMETMRIKDAAIASSINAVAMAGLDGKLFYVNTAFVDLWRLSGPHDAIGRSPLEFWEHPEEAQAVIGVLQQEGKWQGQMRALLHDGSHADLQLSANMVTNEQGQSVCMMGSFVDITESKRVEALLKDANAELERRVELRTAMLKAAKEEAESANNSKSIFLSSMSHELRTPLNAILGYSQLMQMDSSLPKAIIENASEIKRAGEVLLSLMNDILDLSRIESGKIKLELDLVPISEIVKICHAQNIHTAMSHNVALHIATSCSAYHAFADKRSLMQVINNLISNAIKYNREGGKVTVFCAEIVQGKVRISVQDTGQGISVKKQAELFQPFNRLGAEMSNVDGTGIGLVIARKLIESMHGAIGLDSKDGVGSTFWVDIPASKPVSNALSEAPAAPAKKIPRVLVAEDYAPNQNLLQLQLENIGCVVEIAPNGAVALEMWRKNSYDLILTDIDMPVMNGLDFAIALRDEERARDLRIPILAITATVSDSATARYQSAGIDDVLSKPLSIDMLRNGMIRWLGDFTSAPVLLPAKTQDYSNEEDATQAVLDLHYLYHILGQVNPQEARVMVELFMRTADESLLALQSQAGNAVVVAKEMHKQKSSARTVGALRYATLAAALEQNTKDEHYTGIAASLAELSSALQEVKAASAELLELPKGAQPDLSTLAVMPAMMFNSALVVDDDLVVLQQIGTMLGALGMKEIITAANGQEAISLLNEAGDKFEVLVCDLSMPQIDGVELIRHLGKIGFNGGLILISGADEKIITTVNKLAVLQGVRVLGQLQKPVSAAQLAILLAHADDPPAATREAIVAAMEINEFSIWFQPKVDARTLQAVGIEALARWKTSDGKFISPDNFITVAEREGIIGELSRLLVAISLGEAAKLFSAGYPLKVAVNLSGTWLNDLSLPDFILSNTVSSGLQASDVILEVTETGVMEDLTTALDVLSRLRLKGFGLSIDDFGIGYSSFEQLGRIPFTEMKLDRSFVGKGVEDASARAILESSMGMALKLNLATVAEGVETENDLKLVRSLGCDLVQGYLIAKPMPVKDLIVWLNNKTIVNDE